MKEQEIILVQKPESKAVFDYSLKLGEFEVPDVMDDKLYEDAKKAIVEILADISLDEVKDDSVITESIADRGLGADSLDIVEIVMAMEDLFKMEIPDEEAKVVGRVKDIRSLYNVRKESETNPFVLPLWILKRKEEIAEYKAQKSQK